MARAIFVALATGAVISSAAALSMGTATPATEFLVFDRPAYESALQRVALRRADAVEHCEDTTAERDFCLAEAGAVEAVDNAQIDHAYRQSEQSARALQRARIDSRYQLARARCGAMGGAQRDACYVNAHAAKGLALMQAAAPYAHLQGERS